MHCDTPDGPTRRTCARARALARAHTNTGRHGGAHLPQRLAGPAPRHLAPGARLYVCVCVRTCVRVSVFSRARVRAHVSRRVCLTVFVFVRARA